MPRVVNMLTNVQTAEVSLVRRGANDKRFAITKSEDKMDELLKQVLETPAEGEDKLIETLKSEGADEEAIEVAKAHYRLQTGFKDKLDTEKFGVVAKAAGLEVAKAKKEEDDEEEDEGGNPFKGKKKTVKSHVPADMPEEVRKAFEKEQSEKEALRKSLEESNSRIEKIEKEAERKGYIEKCATQYAHVPGHSVEQMGEMLQEAYAVSKEFGEKLEKQWSDTSAALKQSALLGQQGVLHTNDGSASAWAQMQAMAKEMVQKSADVKSEAEALDLVMKQNPDLYEEYLKENPAQQGRR